MFQITTERPDDGAAIDRLLDRAFGKGRQSKISYRYRTGTACVPELSRVARADADGAILGTIRYWPVAIGAASALLLGPIAVEPALKGRGIGVALMRDTLDAAAWMNAKRVVLVGDLGYYERFGFVPAAPHGIFMPDEQPHRLLMVGLAKGAFDGIAGAVARHPGKRRMLRAGWLNAA
jgi:predicted N-acetyltransferase YhbS